jgi:signal peptidase I
MSTAPSSGRSPFIAVVLSLLATGLGHVYCGRVATGLALFLASLLFAPFAVLAAFLPLATGVLVALLVGTLAVLAVYVFAVVDAYRTARGLRDHYELKEYNRGLLYGLFVLVGLTYPVGIVHYVRANFFEAFLVPTASESPNVLPGDRILVNKVRMRGRVPERGDVIAFRHPTVPGQNWIKRVIGLPGDTVEVRANQVIVNGKPLERDRVSPASLASVKDQVRGDVSYETVSGRRYRIMLGPEPATDFKPQTVPDGRCFVLGDNRNDSRDSRHFGFVPLENIIGLVDYIYLPAESWNRFGALTD